MRGVAEEHQAPVLPAPQAVVRQRREHAVLDVREHLAEAVARVVDDLPAAARHLALLVRLGEVGQLVEIVRLLVRQLEEPEDEDLPGGPTHGPGYVVLPLHEGGRTWLAACDGLLGLGRAEDTGVLTGLGFAVLIGDGAGWLFVRGPPQLLADSALDTVGAHDELASVLSAVLGVDPSKVLQVVHPRHPLVDDQTILVSESFLQNSQQVVTLHEHGSW